MGDAFAGDSAVGDGTRMSEVVAEIGALYGPVAANEAAVAAPEHAPALATFAHLLPDLDDAAFVALAARVIAASAATASARDAQHVHARAEMVHAEAVRRHVAAGHAETCGAVRLFAIAYAQAVRDARLDRFEPAVPMCGCRIPTADDVHRAGREVPPLAS